MGKGGVAPASPCRGGKPGAADGRAAGVSTRCERKEEAMDGTSAAATLIDEVYRTYRIDDRGPMLELLREDVVFRIEGDPDRLPFTGLWHGRAGVNEHLDRLAAEWEIPLFQPVD